MTRRDFLKLALILPFLELAVSQKTEAACASPCNDLWGFGGGGLTFPAWFPVEPRIEAGNPKPFKQHLPVVARESVG